MRVPELTLRHDRGITRHWLGAGALEEAGEALGAWLRDRHLFVVTDPLVRELHEESLEGLLETPGEVSFLEVPRGESAKTVSEAEGLWRTMLRAGGKRDSRLLTFGGGSVGDLGGYVAGAFLRGIEYGHLPTTVLAQVDAAIGGKTAVDLPEGKNSVGLFHHPAFVVGEVSWLSTLTDGERRAGLFEAVKMGFLLDPELFARIEGTLDPILDGEPGAMAPVVGEAAAVKIGVVERDLEEAGSRKLLNFGHTLGHALEAATGYEALRHGEAVGYGMLFALELAEARALSGREADRLRGVVDRIGLPPLPEVSVEELMVLVSRDKKAREEGVTWVLPRTLGEGGLEVIEEDEVRTQLESWIREVVSGGDDR